MSAITITKREYRQLLKDSKKLAMLEASGVDNWNGYSDSLHPGDEEGFHEFCERIDREFADDEE